MHWSIKLSPHRPHWCSSCPHLLPPTESAWHEMIGMGSLGPPKFSESILLGSILQTSTNRTEPASI